MLCTFQSGPMHRLNASLSLSVFRYWLKGRARKLEESKISYASLAKVIREGGLKIALITRYSIIPGHSEPLNSLVRIFDCLTQNNVSINDPLFSVRDKHLHVHHCSRFISAEAAHIHLHRSSPSGRRNK